ncbi:pre-rRNA processing protein [Tilletia horrida]|nr:pre-rRNA processing protein [Tilletia horrida]
MPDAFFQRKRKRTDSGSAGGAEGSGRGGSGGSRGGFSKRGGSNANGRASSSSSSRHQQQRRRTDDGDQGNDSDFFEDGDDDDSDVGPSGRAEDMDFRTRDEGLRSDDEAEAAETPAQARVRLAKMYLDRLKDEDTLDGADAVQADKDNIAARLQKDVLEQSGHFHIFLAQRLLPLSDSSAAEPARRSKIVHTRGHRLPVTAAIASSDAQMLFTASKDGTICQWRLSDGKLLTVLPKSSKNSQSSDANSGGQIGAGESVNKGKGRAKGAARSPKSSQSGSARRRRRARHNAALQMAAEAAATEGAADGEDEPMAEASSSNKPNPKNNSKRPNGTSHPDAAAMASRVHYLQLTEGQGHSDAIWALALSSDGRFLASGGLDRKIGLWALDSAPSASHPRPRWLKTLPGHKDSITSLAFRLHSSELYSASLDRTLKLFDAAQGSYIETLFGHQDPVLSISTLRAELAISAGGRDRTCRWWKIRDESQLVFRAGGKSKIREVLEGGDLARLLEKEEAAAADAGSAGAAGASQSKGKIKLKEEMNFVEGSVDCVAMIDDQHFLSGGDSGTIALWSITKKKPIFTQPVAHGLHETVTETEGTILTPRWITSLSCLPYGDLFATGSWDGHVRLWALDRQLRSFSAVPFTIEAPGFVNSLQLLTPTMSKASRGAAADASSTGESRTGPVLSKWQQDRIGPLRIKDAGSGDSSDDDSSDMDSGEPDGILTAPASSAPNGDLNGHSQTGDASTSAATKEIRGRKDEIAPLLVIGVGQEPRLGRWMRVPEAQNGTMIVSFALSS